MRLSLIAFTSSWGVLGLEALKKENDMEFSPNSRSRHRRSTPSVEIVSPEKWNLGRFTLKPSGRRSPARVMGWC